MILVYAFNFLSFVLFSLNIKKFLHVFQLKDYSFNRYLKFFRFRFLTFLLTSIIICLSLFINNKIIKSIVAIVLIVINNLYLFSIVKTCKTPLVKTNKIKHLTLIIFACNFCLFLVPYSFVVFPIFAPLSPIIANALNFYDRHKNKLFILSAQNKLKQHKAKIIAITGSNGKTSVKNILLKMLETTFKVQATPSSFNTPLGISKFINNDLKNDTEYLILEYGARHKNDVLELCNLFGAEYGIITSISAQHLESFKSIENVKFAKSRLSVFLENKLCIYNLDNSYCKEIYLEKQGLKSAVSIEHKADLFAKKIKIKNGKTNFELNIKKNKYLISTSLLGKHNITNILLASSLALELNVNIENIIKTIENLEPTPHRLQLIKTHINILDDSYNCSPASAKEAVWTLMQFPNKKMIVTPGIIEGGKQQYSINYELGKTCSFADFVIVVGSTNKKAILDGLKSQNFDDKNIFICSNLERAKGYFSLLKPNDTLLLLNDLPDDYS